jgi:glutathionylspermidine synthase
MKRVAIAPQPGWQEHLKAVGFDDYVRPDGSFYWIEDACFELSADEADALRNAARTCETLVRAAVSRAISDPAHLARLGLSNALARLAQISWQRGDPSLLGRFDFAWDGVNAPKLLEYNADTPTALYEAAEAQAEWVARNRAVAQFNNVHQRLIATFRTLAPAVPEGGCLHVTSRHQAFDTTATAAYVADCAEQAGIKTNTLDVSEIGLKGGRLVDLEEHPITHLFKLYPWEWLANENATFFAALDEIGVLEPAWRAVASSKGVLVDLWEAAPECPYLLPTFWRESALTGDRVGKPVFGRQGANVVARFDGDERVNDGPYAREPLVWQARAAMPTFDGLTPVFGVWVIGGEVCGIGIREDRSTITGPRANFIPHRIAR